MNWGYKMLKEIDEKFEGYIELSEIIKLRSGDGLSSKNTNGGKFPVYGGNGISYYHNEYNFEGKNLLIGRVGEKCGNVYLENNQIWVTDNALVVSELAKNINIEFLYYSLTHINLNSFASRNAQPLISGKTIYPIKIFMLPLTEQYVVAEILMIWDEVISRLNFHIENEIRKKKSVISKVYRGQISVHGANGENFKRLKHYLEEITLRSNGLINNVLSVSNSKGFIPQDEQFEREVASKDRSNYKVVSRGEFAYNPSRVNVGSIDLLTTQESGILSPMYVVFKCNNDINNRYFYHFLKSDLFLQMIPRYTQGSVRDSLSFDGLCSMKLYIPDIEEQLEYVQALDAIDDYIKKLEQLLELYRLQKRGLMQQLLTGKIRVNVN